MAQNITEPFFLGCQMMSECPKKNVLQADRVFQTMCMCRNLISGHDGPCHVCSINDPRYRSPRRRMLEDLCRNGVAARGGMVGQKLYCH